jgi:hypothetical protein
VTGDLFPELVNFILFTNVLDGPDHLGQAHLFVDKILLVRFQTRFASVQRLLEVLHRERQRFPKLFHQLVQVEKTLRKGLELAHERLDLCFGVFVCIWAGNWHVELDGGLAACGDIPLNAMYTLVDISSNFTTSPGLNPNDIANSLRRAQAQNRS